MCLFAFYRRTGGFCLETLASQWSLTMSILQNDAARKTKIKELFWRTDESLKTHSMPNLKECPANLQKDNNLDNLYGLSVGKILLVLHHLTQFILTIRKTAGKSRACRQSCSWLIFYDSLRYRELSWPRTQNRFHRGKFYFQDRKSRYITETWQNIKQTYAGIEFKEVTIAFPVSKLHVHRICRFSLVYSFLHVHKKSEILWFPLIYENMIQW